MLNDNSIRLVLRRNDAHLAFGGDYGESLSEWRRLDLLP